MVMVDPSRNLLDHNHPLRNDTTVSAFFYLCRYHEVIVTVLASDRVVNLTILMANYTTPLAITTRTNILYTIIHDR